MEELKQELLKVEILIIKAKVLKSEKHINMLYRLKNILKQQINEIK